MMEIQWRIKNWSRFQHYKDRKPPWIKLHRELLDDRQFFELSTEARALLPLLWLIAAESDDGTIPHVPELSWRLRAVEENEIARVVAECFSKKFLSPVGCSEADASAMLASCYQDASDLLHTMCRREEKRRGREEAETEEYDEGSSLRSLPPSPTTEAISIFLELTGSEWRLQAGIAEWADEIKREPKYVGADLPYEIRKAGQWYQGQGRKIKAPDIAIRNWLEKAADDAKAKAKKKRNAEKLNGMPPQRLLPY